MRYFAIAILLTACSAAQDRYGIPEKEYNRSCAETCEIIVKCDGAKYNDTKECSEACGELKPETQKKLNKAKPEHLCRK